MIKKITFFLFLFLIYSISAQEDSFYEVEETTEEVYEYDDYGTSIREKRNFDEDLKSKYDRPEFKYKEEEKKKVKEKKNDTVSLGFFKGLAEFLGTYFPYILAVIIIFIVVKSVLAGNTDFWRFNKKKIEKSPLVITQEEEENIEDTDYDRLLKLAIQNGDFRKATRYYYLLLLKKMNEKELIAYDKDKTNSEYVFELQKTELRKHFSYLLYIYDYVWYGEFQVDATNFSTIENEYQSFFKKL